MYTAPFAKKSLAFVVCVPAKTSRSALPSRIRRGSFSRLYQLDSTASGVHYLPGLRQLGAAVPVRRRA